MIHFVGAGVGGIDYMTVKGVQLLRKADIVGFSPFIDMSILKVCKKNCHLINIRSMTRENVDKLLKDNCNKKFVYLTNGDFAFFGTVQDHWDFLKENKIPFEVVPGITALSACSAVLQNECLLPNISKCITITYLEENGSVLNKQSVNEIAKMNGTIAIYMMNEYLISKLQEKLLQGGLSVETPVVAVNLVFRKEQKIIYTTIGNLLQIRNYVSDYMTLYLIGWVFADASVRKLIAKTPWISDFHRTEYYNNMGIFSDAVVNKETGTGRFPTAKPKIMDFVKK